MKTISPQTVLAPCKVNLYLKITGILPNGYHELDTLFFPLREPYDELMVAPAQQGQGFVLKMPGFDIPQEQNIVYKAWKAFGDATGLFPNLDITIKKGIPTGAGLGGGSSDAAEMLKILNNNAGDMALDDETLKNLALQLGADVPFFLLNGPAWAKGVGEKLTPVSFSMEGYTSLLVCPPIHVSTPWAYKAWDESNSWKIQKNEKKPLTGEDVLRKHTSRFERMFFHNDFENVVLKQFPELRELKEELLIQGAEASVMSGSGASLIGFYKNQKKALTAQAVLSKRSIPAYIHKF